MKKFVLCSESKVKLGALVDALSSLGLKVDVVACNAPSGVRAQPVGFKETRDGANNRVAEASRKFSAEHPRAVVGIENGILFEDGFVVDVGIVVIRTPYGTYYAQSQGVQFPEHCVKEAERRGFERTTVGQIIAERYHCNSDDPHLSLTGRSRREFLAEAVMTALVQMMRDEHRFVAG